MNKIIHRAGSRGFFNHGWLQTYHSFSFAHYHDPERMNFGKLRVLNDDVVAPGQGFGAHAHADMEIVSIPLSGALAHKDSTGHEEVIRPHDIQVMSAGSGIQHSEYNHSESDPVNFLQIWILPNASGHPPRYDQKSFDPAERKNTFQTVVAPKAQNSALWLNQDAYFTLSDMDTGKVLQYKMQTNENGVYLFVLKGEIETADEKLNQRDGIGVWDIDELQITATAESELLLIEVPMK